MNTFGFGQAQYRDLLKRIQAKFILYFYKFYTNCYEFLKFRGISGIFKRMEKRDGEVGVRYGAGRVPGGGARGGVWAVGNGRARWGRAPVGQRMSRGGGGPVGWGLPRRGRGGGVRGPRLEMVAGQG
jgi:hypothetical protein